MFTKILYRPALALVTAIIILLGAELNAEMELHTARDTTTGPERPMGQRGATVADNVV